MARRTSPTFFRRKGAAIACFVLCLAALVVGTYVGIGMLTRFDYGEALPEDAPLRARFPEDDNYLLPKITPSPVPAVTPKPLPTPIPWPVSTPVPLSLYSVQQTRMVMPKDANAPGEGVLTSIKVSEADSMRTITVTGWGFLDGCDASGSSVYLVVSPKSSAGDRFYEAAILPGSTAVQHDASRGTNLERADFRAVFSVRAYADGPYVMGVLVVNKAGKNQVTKGYFEADSQYQFDVKGNAVIGVG